MSLVPSITSAIYISAGSWFKISPSPSSDRRQIESKEDLFLYLSVVRHHSLTHSLNYPPTHSLTHSVSYSRYSAMQVDDCWLIPKYNIGSIVTMRKPKNINKLSTSKAYACTSLSLFLSVCLSIYLSVYLYVCVFLRVHARTLLCVCLCMCACVRACVRCSLSRNALGGNFTSVFMNMEGRE